MLVRLRRLFRAFGRDIVVLWFACRNPAVPRFVKFGSILLALYLISPVDLIPDWFALVGWIDDISLLALGIPLLLKFVPPVALRAACMEADGLLTRLRLWPVR